ncbi:hypothetical protein Lepto7375DRAFT_1413 [Leptolyngbya sp. PCC 7375]|nr:hypothetical protein Lepto7375DRAFT_1413 [Leptolyngbya sp. PCC 7375]
MKDPSDHLTTLGNALRQEYQSLWPWSLDTWCSHGLGDEDLSSFHHLEQDIQEVLQICEELTQLEAWLMTPFFSVQGNPINGQQDFDFRDSEASSAVTWPNELKPNSDIQSRVTVDRSQPAMSDISDTSTLVDDNSRQYSYPVLPQPSNGVNSVSYSGLSKTQPEFSNSIVREQANQVLKPLQNEESEQLGSLPVTRFDHKIISQASLDNSFSKRNASTQLRPTETLNVGTADTAEQQVPYQQQADQISILENLPNQSTYPSTKKPFESTQAQSLATRALAVNDQVIQDQIYNLPTVNESHSMPPSIQTQANTANIVDAQLLNSEQQVPTVFTQAPIKDLSALANWLDHSSLESPQVDQSEDFYGRPHPKIPSKGSKAQQPQPTVPVDSTSERERETLSPQWPEPLGHQQPTQFPRGTIPAINSSEPRPITPASPLQSQHSTDISPTDIHATQSIESPVDWPTDFSTMSSAPSGPSTDVFTPEPLDLEEVMAAISAEISREYHRFYGD